MSAANGSVWKEDVDLPPIPLAFCHCHVQNGRHVPFLSVPFLSVPILSVRSYETHIAAVVATRPHLSVPTVEEAEYRESCHDAAGH